MKRSFAVLALAGGLAAHVSADPGTSKEPPPGPIPFAATSDAARTAVQEALALADAMAPNPRIRAAAEKAVAADSELAIAHYLLGLTYWGDAAKPHLDKAAALAATAGEGERLYVEAALLQRARKNDEALAAFKVLQEKWPGEPLLHSSLAELYQGSGRFEDAQNAAEMAVKLAPQSPRAHALLGSVLISREDYARARTELEAARTRLAEGAVPGNVWFGIATTHIYEGKTARAVDTLRAFLEKYRGTPGNTFPEVFIWNATARIQLESGDAKAALATYDKGFESITGKELSENDKKLWEGRLHHGRGRALARMGKHKEAGAEAEIVKKMIDAGGDAGKEFLPAYHYLAGYLKLQSGEAAAAIQELKRAQDHDDPFRALLLARAYDKAGQKENALAMYQKVYETRRNNLERALSYPEAKKKLAAYGVRETLAGGTWLVVWSKARFIDSASTGTDLQHGTALVASMIGKVVTLGDDCVLFDRPLLGAGAFFAVCGDRAPALLVKRYEGGEGYDVKWKMDEDGLYRTMDGKAERITKEEARRVALSEGPYRADWDKGTQFPARSSRLEAEGVARAE